MKSKVSIIRCPDYDSGKVEKSLRQAIELLGGIKGFIKPASRVLLKPNLLMAKEPHYGITTHPEVVRAVARILKEINCRLILGDGPSVWGGYIEDVGQVYQRTGMKQVCAEEGIQLVNFDKRRMREKFPLAARLDECDYVVNLPKLKTHDFTVMTAAIKNLFGLVPGTFKTELHKNYFQPDDFAAILVDIFQEVRPAITVVDAVTALEGEGPGTSGEPTQTGLIMASCDCVALDSVSAVLLGLKPDDILSTREAARRGLGVSDLNAIEILGESLSSLRGRGFKLPPTGSLIRKIPRPLINLARKLIKYYPACLREKCIKCGACVKICPGKAIKMVEQGIIFDYSKCIACFCCEETCPQAAIHLKKSLLAKAIGL